MSLQKKQEDLKKTIYPFIDEMVEVFYTDNCNNMIENVVTTNSDKSIFLMFVMMYFGIHLKLEQENDDTKKKQIKLMLSDIIRDHDKRRLCIEMFESKMQDIFKFNINDKIIINNINGITQ